MTRKLGTWDATAVLMGTIIGSGIFLVPASQARELPSAGMIVLVWLVGGGLSLLGALTFAELAVRRPAAGGQYVYLRDAWGPLWGFLFGWVTFLVIQTGSIAAVAVGFAKYLTAFVDLPVTPVALGSIALLTTVNCLSLGAGSSLQNLFTVLKLLALAGLIVLGLGSSEAHWSHVTAPGAGTWQAFGVALVGVLWSYDGWNSVGYVAEEVRNPERSLPRALVGGVAAVTVVYVLATLACIAVLGVAGMAGAPEDRVASQTAATVVGAWGAQAMAAGILVSSFGCLNGMILAGAWVYFAMARDGLFFSGLARLSKRETPAVALICQGAWASLLALSGTYDQLFTYAMFISWLFYGLTALALFRLRREGPLPPGSYSTWGYPVTPALFVGLAGLLTLNTLITQPLPSLCGLGLTCAGLPFYLVFRKRSC